MTTRTRTRTGHRYRACGYRTAPDGTPARDASPWTGFARAAAAFRSMSAAGYERGVALQSEGDELAGPTVIKWADGASR